LILAWVYGQSGNKNQLTVERISGRTVYNVSCGNKAKVQDDVEAKQSDMHHVHDNAIT
jgi:hypothetical protein